MSSCSTRQCWYLDRATQCHAISNPSPVDVLTVTVIWSLTYLLSTFVLHKLNWSPATRIPSFTMWKFPPKFYNLTKNVYAKHNNRCYQPRLRAPQNGTDIHPKGWWAYILLNLFNDLVINLFKKIVMGRCWWLVSTTSPCSNLQCQSQVSSALSSCWYLVEFYIWCEIWYRSGNWMWSNFRPAHPCDNFSLTPSFVLN